MGLFVRCYNRYLKRNKLNHSDKGLVNFKNTDPPKREHVKKYDDFTRYKCEKFDHYRTTC